jgi:hypothetical protein
MKLSAKFVKLLSPLTGASASRTWLKQDFVVETKETYPKKVVLTNWNNQIDISRLSEETFYEFELQLESKAFNGSYYSSAVVISQPQTIRENNLDLVTGFKLFHVKMKIASISPEIKGANWTKQEVIFNPIEQGHKILSAFVLNKRVDLSNFSDGDEVSLDFYIESRENNLKWYTDFMVWKIELINKGITDEKKIYDLSDPDSWPF